MEEFKRLTNEELNDFIQRAVVQLNPTLTQQVMSIVLELEEYRNKIENGTLIEFPCNVGTTLYFIVTEEQEDIDGFKYGVLESDKWLYVIDKNGEITIEENDLFFKFEYTYDYTFGENVFLNKAEAEEKLKELKNNGIQETNKENW